MIGYMSERKIIEKFIETETLSEDIKTMQDIISEQEYLINSFIEQIKNPSESFNLDDYVEVFKTIEALKSKI